jgi:hypothetical protein
MREAIEEAATPVCVNGRNSLFRRNPESVAGMIISCAIARLATGRRVGKEFMFPSAEGVFVRFCILLFTTCAILTTAAAGQQQSAPTTTVQSQPGDDSLRIYAVDINGLAGIYVGKGLIITAAQVVGSVGSRLSVRIDAQELEAKVIKAGKFADVDLSLLSVEAAKLPIRLQLRRLEFCDKPAPVGQPVIVVTAESTARSTIASPLILAPELRSKFPTLITDVATTDNSGAGVFAAGRKCLLGIMSRKFQASPKEGEDRPRNISEYFVPAATIWAFIPTWYRSSSLR